MSSDTTVQEKENNTNTIETKKNMEKEEKNNMENEKTVNGGANTIQTSNETTSDKSKKTETVQSNTLDKKNSVENVSSETKKDSNTEINNKNNEVEEKVQSLITQVNENSEEVKKSNSKAKKSNSKKLKKLENNNTIYPSVNDKRNAESENSTPVTPNTPSTINTISTSSTSLKKSKIKKQMNDISNSSTTSSNSVFKSLFLSCFGCWACKSADVDNIKPPSNSSSSKSSNTELESLTSPIGTSIPQTKKLSNRISNTEDIRKKSEVQEKTKWLLKPQLPEDVGKKTLVLDLDETLVHSSFKPIAQPDYVIPVQIENQVHNVYVLKRPGVDEFLKAMGEIYEIVIFTASVGKYADPVLDTLDKYKVVRHRLFREACIHYKGNYVKDLSQLGRNLKHVIILDNSPASYIFHPTNAIPVTSWFNDLEDNELYELIPFLMDLKKVDNVTLVLDNNNE